MATDAWVIVEPGVIVLPTTKYAIWRTENGEYQAYHDGRKIAPPWPFIVTCKSIVKEHMRDLLAVGIEP
jgi:hypothetical protein